MSNYAYDNAGYVRKPRVPAVLPPRRRRKDDRKKKLVDDIRNSRQTLDYQFGVNTAKAGRVLANIYGIASGLAQAGPGTPGGDIKRFIKPRTRKVAHRASSTKGGRSTIGGQQRY